MSRHQPRVAWSGRRSTGLLLVMVVIATTAWLVATNARSSSSKAPTAESAPGLIVVRVRDRVFARLGLDRYLRPDGRVDHDRLVRAIGRALPQSAILERGRSRITVVYARRAALRAVTRMGAAGGTILVRQTPISASTAVTPVQQRLANDCEAAALQILLSGVGVRAPQLEIQRRLRRSGPLDPITQHGRRTWGDPDLGFVGRPDGGGTAGGFGVYEGPVADVARRYGVVLRSFRGATLAALYAHLLAGHPVMVWVGLSDGPYDHWTSPQGRPVTVNYGEHSVVLTGIDTQQNLTVADPLTGTLDRWTSAQFARLWDRLARRALAT